MNDSTQQNSLLVSRRAFLYGTAASAGALALSLAATGCSNDDEADEDYLKVPESALTTQNDFEALESIDGHLQLVGQYEVPYGSLIWVNDEELAACLLPTETGSPLAQIGLLFFGSGGLSTVLNRAVGSLEQFEIYDVRATSSGIIWTEANILKGAWRIYMAKIANGSIEGEPRLVEEGDNLYETPMLAAVGNRGFWQVVPRLPNDAGLTSRLMGATFGKDDAAIVYENARRMGTPPYASADSVTITPRLDQASVYHQLTNIDAETGMIVDTLTLPSGMTPLEAGYGTNGFIFSFANIYNYGDGISNLGTYTPMKMPPNSKYSDAPWFGFARTPTAPPAWCNGKFIIKSSYSVCAVDLTEKTYCVIDVDDGADDYGDYLATSGEHSTFVTYANIDHQPIGKPAVHTCRVKVWTALT